MKCPGCGLYHPPQYENCVSCGSNLRIQEPQNSEAVGTPVVTTERPTASRDSRDKRDKRDDRAQQPQDERKILGSRADRDARVNRFDRQNQDMPGNRYDPENVAERDNRYDAAAPDNRYDGAAQNNRYDSAAQGNGYDAAAQDDRYEPVAQDNGYDSETRDGRDAGYRQDGGRNSFSNEFDMSDRPPDGSLRRSKHVRGGYKSGVPTSVGIMVAATVLLVSAGAVFFFVTKQPDDERLLEQGNKELANGQYAFAVNTLNKALGMRKKDPKVYLSLARAYVGIDQVEKAWDCINQAQQLGLGVVAEPSLASDLANYYRQRGKYERAVDLLRPLAQADITGKKAELADLDALWGDEALRSGNVEQALKCWDEVRQLREGSRFGEADARLATIYQKLANAAANAKDDDKALVYLSKLNAIAQNSRNYEMAADIYERTNQLELAIDQLRKAEKMGARNPVLEKKLAALLSRRGKELLDQGNTDAGLGYLQQAKEMSGGETKLPEITLRSVATTFSSGHIPKISGEVWNATEKQVNSLNLKVEVYDNNTSRVVWYKDQKVVDEFVPPLGSKDSKPFEFTAEDPVKTNGTFEFRVYIDGNFYKSYPIGGKKSGDGDADSDTTEDTKPLRVARPKPVAKPKPVVVPQNVPTQVAPNVVPTESAPPVAPQRGSSSEEKTMKDLEP